MRLTDQGIRGLPFTEKGRRSCTDDSVHGLAVCVGTRTKTLTLIVRRGERRKRHTLGNTTRPIVVRMVLEHERDRPSRWAAVVSIAEKVGCVPQTLNEW